MPFVVSSGKNRGRESLSDIADLDTMVTVVYAYIFFREVVSTESLAKHPMSKDETS